MIPLAASGGERTHDLGSKDNCFQSGADFAEGLFDHDGFVPTLDGGGILVMPTIAKNTKHCDHNPLFKAPFNAPSPARHSVATEARASGATGHLRRLFCICTLKGAELLDVDKDK